MRELLDFVQVYVQLRRKYPAQGRRRSFDIARRACWPTTH